MPCGHCPQAVRTAVKNIVNMRLKILCLVSLVLGVCALLYAVRTLNSNNVKATQAPVIAFHYSHRGTSYDSIYSYEVEASGNDYRFRFLPMREEDAQTAIMTESDVAALHEIINRFDLWKWHGFNKSASGVLDGAGFTLTILFADGTVIEAHGNNAFPQNYNKALSEIKILFSQYIKETEN